MRFDNKEFNPAAFSVYGPKIVAMRGGFRDQALESRFLSEEMGRRPLRPDIPIQLPPGLKDEALALRNRLLHFRLTNLSMIKSDPSRLIAGLEPRLNQTALSLLSLVDDAAVQADIADVLVARQAQLSEERARSAKARVMAALAQAFAADVRPFVPLREITDRANRDDETLSAIPAREVGQILRAASVPLRKSHGTIVVGRPARSA